MTRVSLIVPAYNEVGIVASNLRHLRTAFPEAEIILVDDGSTDETPQTVGPFLPELIYLRHYPNRGKGFAIRRGVLAASGDIIVFTDADLPFGTHGISRIVQTMLENPRTGIAIAAKIDERRSISYRLARAAVRRLVTFATGVRVPDTQAGLKAFTKDAAHAIFPYGKIDRFAADIEMLYMARIQGIDSVSVPLELEEDRSRPTSFTLGQGFLLLRDIWWIRFGTRVDRRRGE